MTAKPIRFSSMPLSKNAYHLKSNIYVPQIVPSFTTPKNKDSSNENRLNK